MERPISDGQKQWVPEDLPARQSNDKMELFHWGFSQKPWKMGPAPVKVGLQTIYIYI